MSIVAIGRLVLDVCSRYGDATLSLFRSFVDGAIFEKLCEALFCLSFRYGSCQSGLV